MVRVMLAMTLARMRSRWSGGENRRVSGPAADDADGPLELDPVRVDAGLGGGLADQGRDGVVGEQVAVDLLADHVRALGAQHPPRPNYPVAGLSRRRIKRQPVLGGLINEYERAA